MTYLAYWTVGITQINQQVVTFQVKVHYILPMKILHSKCNIHGNHEAFPLIQIPEDST